MTEILTNSSNQIIFNYSGISYLCEIKKHNDCGGFCNCICHKENK